MMRKALSGLDAVAPFAVGLINLKVKDTDAKSMCEDLYQTLIKMPVLKHFMIIKMIVLELNFQEWI